MTSDGDFHKDKLIRLLLKNANTIILTASIDGFKQNRWSDKHENHLESVMLSFGTQQKTASSCKMTRQNVEDGPEV